MNNFAVVLYTIFIPIVFGIAQLLSALHPKLKTFFRVRKGVFEELKPKIDTLPSSTFRLWVHAASVGEFEQARPIIAALKERHPELTLFCLISLRFRI